MYRAGIPTHNTVVAYILWLFGFTGAHRFYFKRRLTGMIWFFTAGLFGIGWLIDLFLIPGMARQSTCQFKRGPYDYSVAWLLLTFGGVFGLHRLYLGKYGTGALYLCTFGLFMLGYLYDCLTLNGTVEELNMDAGYEDVTIIL
jgi:TM2 domain-containing membrane protein YozV